MLPNDGPVANAPIHLFLNSYTLTLTMSMDLVLWALDPLQNTDLVLGAPE